VGHVGASAFSEYVSTMTRRFRHSIAKQLAITDFSAAAD